MTGRIPVRWLFLLWAVAIGVVAAALWRGAEAPIAPVVRRDPQAILDSLRAAERDSVVAPAITRADSSLGGPISPMNRATPPHSRSSSSSRSPTSSASSAPSASTPKVERAFTAARVDEILESMDWGNVAFDTPSEMKLEEPSYLHLLLDVNRSIEELKARIPGAAAKEGERVRISAAMEARLTGTSFEITAITSDRQAVSASEVTEWKWEVRPMDTGPQYLYLTLTAILDVDGSYTPRTIETFERTIEVRVTGWRRVSRMFYRNWEWLWTLVIVPLSAVAWYLWNRAVGRRRGPSGPRRVGF